MTDFKQLCAELLRVWDAQPLPAYQSDWASVVASVRTALAEPEDLPPGYIDPEHSDADRRLLEVFYTACRSEGGTADEIYLRGIRAVLAVRATLAQPEPDIIPKPQFPPPRIIREDFLP